MKASACQHDDAVDGRQERVHDVLDPDHRDAGYADASDERHQRFTFHFAQAACDFVEQQEFRLCGQSARQLKPFAVKQRQRVGLHIGFVGELAILQDLRAEVIDIPLAPAFGESAGDDQILEHRHAAERLRNLKRAGDAKPAALGRRQTGDVAAFEQHASRIRRQHAGDDAEQRRFARAVRAEHAERFTFGKFEDRGRRRSRPRRNSY